MVQALAASSMRSERTAGAHFGVRTEGVVHPLCRSWRSNWNWTLERAQVACPQCRAALAAAQPPATPGEDPT